MSAGFMLTVPTDGSPVTRQELAGPAKVDAGVHAHRAIAEAGFILAQAPRDPEVLAYELTVPFDGGAVTLRAIKKTPDPPPADPFGDAIKAGMVELEKLRDLAPDSNSPTSAAKVSP